MSAAAGADTGLAAARRSILLGKAAEAERALDSVAEDHEAAIAVERAWCQTLRFAEPATIAPLLPSADALAGDPQAAGRRLVLLGVLANRSGEPDQALGFLNDALQHVQALGDTGGLIDVWLEFARVLTWMGRDGAAFLHLSDALSEATGTGDAPRIFLTLVRFGDLHLELRRFERALQFYERARQQGRDHEGGLHWHRLALDQARAELGAGQAQDALDRAQGFLEGARADDGLTTRYHRFLAARVRALALVRLGRLDDAEAALAALDGDARAAGGLYEANEAALVRAEYLMARGDLAAAQARLETLLPDYVSPGNLVPATEIRLMLAEAYAGLGQASQGGRALASGIRQAERGDLKDQVARLKTAQTRLGLYDTVPMEEGRRIVAAGELADVDDGDGDEMQADAGAGAGGYVLLERVGHGGFGTVYRALDLTRNRDVAVKRFRLAGAYDRAERDAVVASVRRELDATAELSHPGIARTLACGREADGEIYVVQDFVHGPDLRQLMRAGAIERRRALEIVRDVALALDALAAAGVRHRDVKPDNIVMRGGRAPVLVDFGIAARAGADAVAAGTRRYLPPETLAFRRDSARRDLYALALVLVELFGGEVPTVDERPSYAAILGRHRTLMVLVDDLEPPGLVEALRNVLRLGVFRPNPDASVFAGRLQAVVDRLPA